MENNYICDDRRSTPEYLQALCNMTEEELERHFKELDDQEHS